MSRRRNYLYYIYMSEQAYVHKNMAAYRYFYHKADEIWKEMSKQEKYG